MPECSVCGASALICFSELKCTNQPHLNLIIQVVSMQFCGNYNNDNTIII